MIQLINRHTNEPINIPAGFSVDIQVCLPTNPANFAPCATVWIGDFSIVSLNSDHQYGQVMPRLIADGGVKWSDSPMLYCEAAPGDSLC